MLVIIGATPEGKKELVGLIDGVRESAQSWRELLLDLKRRASRSRPTSPSPTARSASGRRSRKCGPGPAASAVGCTRPPTCSTSCPRAGTRRQSVLSRRSGWPRPGTTQTAPSTPSSRPTPSNTTRRPPAWSRIAEDSVRHANILAKRRKTVLHQNPLARCVRPSATVLRRVIAGCPDDPITLVVRAELHDQSLHCLLPIDRIAAMRERLEPHERVEPDPVDARLARLHLPLVRRRGETWVLKGPSAGNRPDPVLVKALRSAHAMLHQDDGGLPVLDAGPDTPYRRRLVRLAFLAPEIQRAIVEGRQSAGVTPRRHSNQPDHSQMQRLKNAS